MANSPEGRIRIIAENLARAALAEMKRDVQGAGTAAAGASTGFGKMVFANGQLLASTSTARHGLNVMENGLRTLAFQATGIPGPIGKIVQGFGLLGVGSLAVTGFIGGIGGAALAYTFLTSESGRATKAMDDFAKGLSKATTPAEQFKVLLADIRQAEAGLTTGVRGGLLLAVTQLGQGNLVGAFLDSQRAKLRESAFAGGVATLAAQVIEHDKLITGLREEADLLGATAVQAARLRAARAGLTAVETADYVAQARRLEQRRAELAVLLEYEHVVTKLKLAGLTRLDAPGLLAGADQARRKGAALDLDLPFGKQDSAGKAVLEASFHKTGRGTGLIIAQSFLSAVQLAQQGGAGGVFGAGGALLSGLSGLKGMASLGPFGIIASTFGSALSLFDRKDTERERNAERRHKELLGTLHEGFLRVTVINADGSTAAGLYELHRAERLGGEPRLGGL